MPTPIYALTWDVLEERFLETGVDHGVLYVQENGTYPDGVVWNGLTGVTENPSGADANDFYADNIKYASIRAAETYGATIEAYTYPDEFEECDGSAEIAPGVMAGQQARKPFGFSFRSKVINAANPEDESAYKLHMIYGATASPSSRGYQTVNESPDAITFSWEITTIPVNVTGYKPTASLTIDTTKLTDAQKTKLAALEQVLYGTPASGNDEAVAPRLPLPDEIISMMS